jgi:hypothetical protein
VSWRKKEIRAANASLAPVCAESSNEKTITARPSSATAIRGSVADKPCWNPSTCSGPQTPVVQRRVIDHQGGAHQSWQ